MREIFTRPVPDGKWIAISERVPRGQGGYATISLIDFSRHRRELTGDHQIDISKLAWLPDGSAIIFTGNPYSSQPQQIYTARYSDGRITRITGDSAAYFVRALNLSADGNSIFAVHRYDISSLWLTGQNPGQARQLSMEDMVPEPQSFGLDGQRVFYYSTVGQSDGIWRSDLSGGAPVRITPADVSAANISLSSDGHWIAFNAIADGRRSIWIADTDGKSPRQLVDGSFPYLRWMARKSFSSGRARILVCTGCHPQAVLRFGFLICHSAFPPALAPMDTFCASISRAKVRDAGWRWSRCTTDD